MKKKDTRPLKDPNWIAQGKKTLINFLVFVGFSEASTKSLKNFSKKDFQKIFTYLYGFIDPDFVFEEPVFEDQAAYLIKELK